jgi:hypothetical protein
MGIWVGVGCKFTNCIHNTGEDEALVPSKRKRCRMRRPRLVKDKETGDLIYCLDEVDYREFNKIR